MNVVVDPALARGTVIDPNRKENSGFVLYLVNTVVCPGCLLQFQDGTVFIESLLAKEGATGMPLVIARLNLGEQDTKMSHSVELHESPQRSTAIATAFPPPRQSAAIPRFTSRRIISYSSVTRTRAPLAPIGCPIATAPPLTLTFTGFNPSSRITPSACTENASFSS